MKIIAAILITLFNLNLFAADLKPAQIIEIKVTEKGFQPSSIDVPADVPVTLKITRVTDKTCATDIKIKSRKIEQKLPLNEAVIIDLGKIKKGTLDFSCGMNMEKGKIISK